MKARPWLLAVGCLVAACGTSTVSSTDGGDVDARAAGDGGATPDGGVGSDAAAPADAPAVAECGDGRCEASEDATSCCGDCGVCTEGAVVRMETGVAGGAPGGALTPGGLADMHASFAGGPFAEVVFRFTIVEEPVAGTSYFWAQQFFFDGTTQGGYTGVQTGGIMGGAVVGKMLIFSIWDAVGATPGPGAGCEPFGGEGIGYSCRLAFEWRENVTYRLILREASAAQWSMSVFDPERAEERLLGTIQVDASWGRVRPPTAGFAEYFGAVASCEATPRAVALIHQPEADGMPPTSVDASAYGTCVAQASSVCTGTLCR